MALPSKNTTGWTRCLKWANQFECFMLLLVPWCPQFLPFEQSSFDESRLRNKFSLLNITILTPGANCYHHYLVSQVKVLACRAHSSHFRSHPPIRRYHHHRPHLQSPPNNYCPHPLIIIVLTHNVFIIIVLFHCVQNFVRTWFWIQSDGCEICLANRNLSYKLKSVSQIEICLASWEKVSPKWVLSFLPDKQIFSLSASTRTRSVGL